MSPRARPTQERRPRVGAGGRKAARGWLAACSLAWGCLFAHPTSAQSDAAQQHYARALEHLRAGKLEEARDEFREAYRVSPHYLVLYNLGRVSLELGEHRVARGYLERYLELGGDALTAERRAAVEKLLAQAHASEEAAVAEGAAPVQPVGRAHEFPVPPAAPPPHSVPSPAVPLPPSGVAASDTRASRTTVAPSDAPRSTLHTQLGLALSGGGGALLLAGAGVLIWNQMRYSEYEATRRELAAAPPSGRVASQEHLDALLEFAHRSARSDADFASIERFDVVGWTMAGIGGALLAGGIALHVTRPRDAALVLGARSVGVALSF